MENLNLFPLLNLRVRVKRDRCSQTGKVRICSTQIPYRRMSWLPGGAWLKELVGAADREVGGHRARGGALDGVAAAHLDDLAVEVLTIEAGGDLVER